MIENMLLFAGFALVTSLVVLPLTHQFTLKRTAVNMVAWALSVPVLCTFIDAGLNVFVAGWLTSFLFMFVRNIYGVSESVIQPLLNGLFILVLTTYFNLPC